MSVLPLIGVGVSENQEESIKGVESKESSTNFSPEVARRVGQDGGSSLV
jgi:hypothetical protein